MAKSRKEQVLDALKSKQLPSYKFVMEEAGQYFLRGEDEPLTDDEFKELELNNRVIIIKIRQDDHGREIQERK